MVAYCMVNVEVHNEDEYAKYAKLAGPAVENSAANFWRVVAKLARKRDHPVRAMSSLNFQI